MSPSAQPACYVDAESAVKATAGPGYHFRHRHQCERGLRGGFNSAIGQRNPGGKRPLDRQDDLGRDRGALLAYGRPAAR
jgi:hypothetical protein